MSLPLLFLIIYLFLHGTSCAQQQSYLLFSSPKEALTRSEQQCIVLKCDGVGTKYWWPVITLKDGTAAIAVDVDIRSPFSKEVTVDNATGKLSPDEEIALKSKEDIKDNFPSSLLSPSPVTPLEAVENVNKH